MSAVPPVNLNIEQYNLITAKHFSVFRHFSDTTDQLKVFVFVISLLAAASRMVKADFFNLKNTCSVSFYACNHSVFNLVCVVGVGFI